MPSKNMRDSDDLSYIYRAVRQQRDKAFQTLDGLLRGIGADGVVDSREITELREWLVSHRRLDKDAPFREVLDAVERALVDGKIDPTEVDEIRFVCSNCASSSAYFDEITQAIQRLQGCLHGVIANQKINEKELNDISSWVEENFHLRSLYPVTEIEAVVVEVMRDGVIDVDEHERLMCFFECFVTPSSIYSADRRVPAKLPTSFGGLFAVDPMVTFKDKCFCFTGIAEKGTRKELEAVVYSRGGHCAESIVVDLDYLVIGGRSNPCWAFSTYGRKIERVMDMRKRGQDVLIIQERDFWDA